MARTKSATPDAATRVLALHGPEQAVQKDHLDALRTALEKQHGEVQTVGFDGKSATLADVFDELRGYSLMGGYKLVVVDPADDFLKAHREALERYAADPVDHATLVLRVGTWHKGKLDKVIEKVGAVIKCEPPKPAEAVARLVARAKQRHGLTLERPAAQMLVDRLGVHLTALETELDKLAAMVGEGETIITTAMVQEAVGQSNDEKAWVVQEAVLGAMASQRPGQAIAKVRELIDVGGQPEVLVMYSVADLMRKLAIAGQMKADGASDTEIGKAMRLWGPGRLAMFIKVLERLGSPRAARLLGRALDADARSKSGLGNANRNLEAFCATLADVPR